MSALIDDEKHSETASRVHSQPDGTRLLPIRLDVYGDRTTRADGWYLTDHKQQPIYAVNRNPGRKPRSNDRADIILYSGPTEEDIVLASASYMRTNHGSYRVMIPSMPAGTGKDVEVIVSNSSTWNKTAWRFAMETDIMGHREEFEWRSSSSPHIAQLLGGKSSGYKLVRLRSNA
ncbi:hypothetical protein AK830_g9856 [Neonectria ditissima]|uniref:Uncharacterized protein n=1 Tax=Neonectria ditissima TaxID=78410 RepID=A0A0P7AR96_9HYPO|nr:hypothetical protein AK830_g9856 [Neonectria ditissima]